MLGYRLIIAIIALHLFLSATFAEEIRCIEPLGQVSVDILSTDSSIRYSSAGSVLEAVISGVESDCLFVKREFVVPTLGHYFQFSQRYRGLRVQNSNAWLKASFSGKALWGGAAYHTNINLPHEAFLDDANNQTALIIFAEAHCPDIDEIYQVEPVVFPEFDSTSENWSYRYALIAYSKERGKSRFLDWATGDSMEALNIWNIDTEIQGNIRSQRRPNGATPTQGDILPEIKVRSEYTNDQGALVKDSVTSLPGGTFEGLLTNDGAGHSPWSLYAFADDPFTENQANKTWRIPALADHSVPWTGALTVDAVPNGNTNYSIVYPTSEIDAVRGTQLLYFPRAVKFINDRIDIIGESAIIFTSLPQEDQTLRALTDWQYDRPTLNFGTQNHYLWGTYEDVTLHELAHGIQLNFYGSNGVPSGELFEGIESAEGIANFIAAAYGRLQGDDPPGNPLLVPSEVSGSQTELDIAPAGVRYDPLLPQRSFVLSAALWDWLVEVGTVFGSAAETQVLDMVLAAHVAQPVNFREWVYAIAVQNDDGDLCTNGWTYGQEMYNSFWLARGIESRPFQALQGPHQDGWMYYHNASNALNSHNYESFQFSGTQNYARGAQGDYLVYSTDSLTMFGYLLHSLGTWHFTELPKKIKERANNPTLSVVPLTTGDEIYVTFGGKKLVQNGAGQEIKRLKVSIPPNSTSCGISVSDGRSLSFYPTYPSISAPNHRPTILGGISEGDIQGRKLNYAVIDPTNWDAIPVTRVLPGTPNESITSVASHSVNGSGRIYVTWVMDDEVHYRLGDMNTNGDDFNWSGPHTIAASNDGVIDKTNATIVYSLELDAVFIAWEGTSSHGNQVIGYTWSQADEETFEEPQYFNDGDCNFSMNPALQVFYDDNTAVPEGYPPVVIAYDRHEEAGPYSDAPSIYVRALQVNGTWEWMAPALLGSGHSPTVSTATADNGYGVAYVSNGASAPYGITVEDFLVTYPPASPVAVTETIMIASNDTLSTPVMLTKNIVIENGATLAIPVICDDEATPRISGLPGTKIIVKSGGTLRIAGNSSKSVKFESAVPTQTWGGITVEPHGSLFMNYVEMKDCDSVCIYTNKPDAVSLNNSNFIGNKMLGDRGTVRLTNSPAIAQSMNNCTITGEGVNGYGLYVTNSAVNLDSITVENCKKINTGFLTSTGTVSNSTFKDRVSSYGMLFSGAGTTPNFTCCTFENLAPWSGNANATVYAASGSAPTFGYEGATGDVSNTFIDSSAYMLKMSGKGVLPVIDNPTGNGAGGKNDWNQNYSSGQYLYWGSPYPNPLKAYPASGQYWNMSPVDIKDFQPNSTSYFDISGAQANPWELCGGTGSGTSYDPGDGRAISALDDVPSVYDSLFAEAVSLEAQEEYQNAQNIFRSIATNTNDYRLKWQATTHVVSTQRALDTEAGEVWIPSLIDSLILADSSEYSTFVYGNRLLSTYRLAREEYSEAITICTELLNGELTAIDSILVSIDLLGIQMAAGLVEDGGGLDDVGNSSIPQSLRCASMSEAMNREMELLDALSRINGGSEPTTQAPLPTEFRLYQNFPNPFNPTTQIEFDLPERVPVAITVFNTLGQEVMTIDNAVYAAGHHVVTWNGKSSTGLDVATGLYIYQIKAGSFIDTKKMVLMR